MKKLDLVKWKENLPEEQSDHDKKWKSPYIKIALEYTNFWFSDCGLDKVSEDLTHWQVAFCDAYFRYIESGCKDNAMRQFNEIRDKLKTLYNLDSVELVSI